MEGNQSDRPRSYPSGQHQALPPISSLTNLPPPEPSPNHLRSAEQDIRDSGNWSLSQSKHSSGVSNTTGLQLQTILNAEDSPSRVSGISVPDTPHSARASLQTTLPPVNQGFHDPRASVDANSLLDRESRRSSIDSRMNMGMNHLQISPSSPYASENVSRVSLVSNLQQQRGITTDQRVNGVAPVSPLGQRAGLRPQVQPRRAPVISTNPRSVSGMPDPTAPNPTKGYAWAFPDHPPQEQDGRRGSSSGESSVERSVPSRQNSFAASMTSSIFTTDSAMPAGQKRFEDGDIPQTHHHSLQHRSISNLQASEASATAGTGNYSRTPELRISHKMAERKRRSEMKNLFDELNGILPNSPGGKSSKWEILTKSIEHIKQLKHTDFVLRRDNERMRQDTEMARRCEEDNRLLRAEVEAMWLHMQRLEPGSPHVFGNVTSQLTHSHSQPASNPPGVLPPLAQNQWTGPAPAPPAPTAMQGVEFPSAQPYDHR